MKNSEKGNGKKILSIIKSIIVWSLILFFTAIVIQSIQVKRNTDYIPKIFGHTYLNVLSDSMVPEFTKNDLVIGESVKDVSSLQVGDVITYKYGKMLVTHRIIDIDKQNNMIQTKGDANKTPDDDLVEANQIVSRYSTKIPKVGFIIAKLQDMKFLALLWAILMFFTVQELFVEIRKVKKAKSEKDNNIVSN